MEQNQTQNEENSDIQSQANVTSVPSEHAPIDRPMDAEMPQTSSPPHAEDKQSELNVPGGKGNVDIAGKTDIVSDRNQKV